MYVTCKLNISFSISPVPDKKSPEYSRGRLSKALGQWGSGNLEGEGWARVGRGVGQEGSVYKQPETEVDDSCHS
jgi:hypothetical protein